MPTDRPLRAAQASAGHNMAARRQNNGLNGRISVVFFLAVYVTNESRHLAGFRRFAAFVNVHEREQDAPDDEERNDSQDRVAARA